MHLTGGGLRNEIGGSTELAAGQPLDAVPDLVRIRMVYRSAAVAGAPGDGTGWNARSDGPRPGPGVEAVDALAASPVAADAEAGRIPAATASTGRASAGRWPAACAGAPRTSAACGTAGWRRPRGTPADDAAARTTLRLTTPRRRAGPGTGAWNRRRARFFGK
ncbi:hypothetical protein SHIRM173S_12883 [Streptomyces hirsutus]